MTNESNLPSKFSLVQRELPRWLQRCVPVIVLCLVGAFAYFSGWRIEDLSERLRGTGVWAPVLFAGLGVAAMSMLVPKTWISLAAGALLGTPLGCLTMLIAAVAAAALNYYLGRIWVRRTNDPGPQDTSQNGSVLSTVVSLAREAGFRLHLLIRLAPIPTSIISYSMGAADARFIPYLLAAAVAVLPQCAYVHTAALAASGQFESPYQKASLYFSIAMIVLIIVALPRIVLKHLNESRQLQTASDVERRRQELSA